MTTATEWLAENPGDVEALGEMLMGVEDLPIRLWTEIPRWMKEEIAAQLEATFSQPYWDDIAKTTLGDAEAALEEGLREGWSIRKIAGEMRESLGGDRYAKVRSLNIARTESGNALNGARKASLDRLQDEVGDSVPMKQTWLSVLGNTTRDTHASLDGVPAGKDGMWKLAGIKIPWPGYFLLPASERCGCQCTLTVDFGIEESTARELIQAYYDRDESNIEGKSIKHLPGQHDQSTHGRPGSSEIEEVLRGTEFEDEFIATETSTGGFTKMTFPNGMVAVHKSGSNEPDVRVTIKPGTQYKREAAYYDVASTVGNDDLVPVTIVRKKGSVQQWVDDAEVGGQVTPLNRMFGKNKHDIERAAAQDFILGNTDRNDGNWLVTKDGKVQLIDNGLSMPTKKGSNDTAEGRVALQEIKLIQRGFVQEAASKQMILDRVRRQWSKKWPDVEKALKNQGIEKEAISLAKSRYDALMDKKYKTFYSLVEAFRRGQI